MSNRLWCTCLFALSACRPVDPNPTLNGMPVEVGTVDLGAVNPWVAREDLLRFRAFVQEPSKADLRAELDGEVLVRSQFLYADGARTHLAIWPRTKVGSTRAVVRLFLDDEQVGQWVVTRQVSDVGLRVCALPGTEEGLLEPRCTRPDAFTLGGELPPVTDVAPVDRRLQLTVDQGIVELVVGPPGSGSAGTWAVTPEQPLMLDVDSTTPVMTVGGRPFNPTLESAPISMQVRNEPSRVELAFRASQPGVHILSVSGPPSLALKTTLPVSVDQAGASEIILERSGNAEPATLRVQYEVAGQRRGFQVRL